MMTAPHTSGMLGDLTDLYYRRVWRWDGAWVVAKEGFVRSFVGPNCSFEEPTFCALPPPYIAERWWKWSPSTIGTGGDWVYAGDRQNW